MAVSCEMLDGSEFSKAHRENQDDQYGRQLAPKRHSRGGPIVRFGSLADILRRNRDVRFTFESGHVQRTSRCPLSANSRHRAGQLQCF